ncbi:MAG: hypothetical protein M3282_13130, partial [Gemmatimonadota bacterium]|nr:hypothetical protein [Gemmatimonadota bacterium]
FQVAHHAPPGWLQSVVMLPEWYLVIGVLGVLSLSGAYWPPLFAFAPLLGISIVAPIVEAALMAAGARSPLAPRGVARVRQCALTAALHLLQPLARLWGRLRFGLTPWRRTVAGFSWPGPRTRTTWSEKWRSAEVRLHALETALRRQRAATRRGGDYDLWDLEVRGGLLGAARMLMVIEEHGVGRQLVRFRIWPRLSSAVVPVSVSFTLLAAGAAYDGARPIAVAFAGVVLLTVGSAIVECAGALAALTRVVEDDQEAETLRRTHGTHAPVEREVAIPVRGRGDAVPRPDAADEPGSRRRAPDALPGPTPDHAAKPAVRP